MTAILGSTATSGSLALNEKSRMGGRLARLWCAFSCGLIYPQATDAAQAREDDGHRKGHGRRSDLRALCNGVGELVVILTVPCPCFCFAYCVDSFGYCFGAVEEMAEVT